jgi:hypothetical protein
MSKPATRAVPAVGGSSVVSMCTVVDLPGAVRAEEAVDLAGWTDEVDSVDRARALLELPDTSSSASIPCSSAMPRRLPTP